MTNRQFALMLEKEGIRAEEVEISSYLTTENIFMKQDCQDQSNLDGMTDQTSSGEEPETNQLI